MFIWGLRARVKGCDGHKFPKFYRKSRSHPPPPGSLVSHMGSPGGSAVALFSFAGRSHHLRRESSLPAMEGNLELVPERRRCLRQTVHAPAFASFDGVSGGMILDLSEEGLSMQMGDRMAGHVDDALELERKLPVRVALDLPEPARHVETTGYIAWADALGRAGVRFSELPEEARQRLNEWLTINAAAPSHIAPRVAV